MSLIVFIGSGTFMGNFPYLGTGTYEHVLKNTLDYMEAVLVFM